VVRRLDIIVLYYVSNRASFASGCQSGYGLSLYLMRVIVVQS